MIMVMNVLLALGAIVKWFEIYCAPFLKKMFYPFHFLESGNGNGEWDLEVEMEMGMRR